MIQSTCIQYADQEGGEHMAKGKKRWVFRLLMIILACIFLFSLYQVLRIWMEYRKGEKTYEALTSYVELPQTTSSGQTEGQTNELTETNDFIFVDFATLVQQYPDVVAWVYLPDSTLNYPVVQGSDNEYYLTHMVDGAINSAGSIFMDYRCDATFSDKHTILYGHYMHNDSMFRSVARYQEQSYFDTHPVIQLATLEKQYELVIFSAYVATVDQNAWELYFSDDAQYAEWLKDITARSIINTEVTPQTTDRVVTLSTCTSLAQEEKRVVVHAVLREVPSTDVES